MVSQLSVKIQNTDSNKAITQLVKKDNKYISKDLELLQLVEVIIETFFDIKTISKQIIPDSFDEAYQSKALLGKLKDRAIVELFSQNLGFTSDNLSGKRKKSWKVLEEDYANIKRQIHLKTTKNILNWLTKNKEEVITEQRLKIIKNICEIFGLITSQSNLSSSWLQKYGKVQQISEESISWIFLYGLETTRITTPDVSELFYLTTAFGGDTTPPPYVESYITEPLVKLSQLNQLKITGKINFLPQFFIVSSLHTQLIENSQDKAGNPINQNLHIYNSRVTLLRTNDFIRTFFPEVVSYCHIIEFPAYKTNSLARLFFGCLWKYIPVESNILGNLFRIKGNVQSSPINNNNIDYIKNILGNDINPYVSRHLFSNMIFSHANTLKFASDATEPQFHLTSMALYSALRKQGENIVNSILHFYNKIKEVHPEINKNLCDSEIENLIHAQISKLPSITKVHGQLGMTDCHACYYQHKEELSLREIINSQKYSAHKLSENQRNNKAKKLEKTFARSTDLLGKQTYLDFLAMWEPIYSSPNTNPEKLKQSLQEQFDEIKQIILSFPLTQIILNYHLS